MFRCLIRSVLAITVSTTPLFLGNTAWGQSPAARNSQSLIDLRFPGGSLGDYLDLLRKESGGALNVVVMNDLSGPPLLPAMELKGVKMQAALNLIAGHYQLETGGAVKVEVAWQAPLGEQEPTLARVSSIRDVSNPSVRVKVWTLSELIGGDLSAEDVLTAVELAVGLTESSGAKAADVRFHEATGLLVANGTPRQVDSIDDVVAQLRERMHQRQEVQDVEQAVQGVEDFVEWIQEMRQFDAAQQAEAQKEGAAEGTSPPSSDLRGSTGMDAGREAHLLEELERLSRLVKDQERKIKSLEERLSASRK